MEKTDAKPKFRQILPILVLICCTALFSFRHPYHLAVTTVTYSNTTKQLNVEIKAFYHDMEDAINKMNSTEVDIKNHPKEEERDEMVYGYVLKNFGVSYTDGPLVLMKESITFKDEYIYIRYKGENIEKTKIQFYNTILYDLEKTQTHIFNFKSGNKKEAKKIVNPDYEVHWEL